jgi:hypothetical protein
MAADWAELLHITGGSSLIIERVRINGSKIAVEGEFELPPLAQLSTSDQVFVTAFVKCHGSIKEMERLFGISYPTVKNRLNRISDRLEFVEFIPPSSQEEILDRIDEGELSVEEAIEKLKGGK